MPIKTRICLKKWVGLKEYSVSEQALMLSTYYCVTRDCEVKTADAKGDAQSRYVRDHHKNYKGFDDEVAKKRFALVNSEFKGDKGKIEVLANEVLVSVLKDRLAQRFAWEYEKMVVVEAAERVPFEEIWARKHQAFFGIGVVDSKDKTEERQHEQRVLARFYLQEKKDIQY